MLNATTVYDHNKRKKIRKICFIKQSAIWIRYQFLCLQSWSCILVLILLHEVNKVSIPRVQIVSRGYAIL